MSIASRIQEIETHIGDVYDTINYSYDTTGVNKNIINIPKYLKKGYIDIINNGIDQLYSNFPKVSGIGSNLSLTPTYEAPMRNLPLGNTYQQTYTGKNLLPYPYESTGTTVNGITFTPQSDGSVLVNGTATAQATFPLYGTSATTNQKELTGNYLYGGTSDVKLRVYNHSGSGYTNLGTDTGNGVQINKTTYTTGYIELVVASGTTINNVVIKPMMLMNLDDTTYEPYVGGVPSPNPDYPQAIQSATGLQNIEICGKNLFDKNNTSNLLDNVSINNSTSVISDANGFYSLKINCKPNTTYTISKVVSSRFIVAYSNNSSYTSGEVLLGKIANNSATSLTITTGSEAKLLYVFYSKLSDETTYTLQQILDSIQIEESLTATEYESYKGNIYEVNLGKNLFDINNSGGKTQCSFNITGNNLEITSTTTGNSYIYYDVPVKTSSTYNISCTAVADNVAYCYIRGYKTNGTYDTLLDFTDATNLNAHFNTDTDTSYLRIFLYATRVNSGGSSGNKTTYSNIQLEKGDIQTSYSPYFTPIELNKINTYQDSIKKSTGKNLFDKTAITSSKIISPSTGNTSTNNDYGASDYIPVKANVSYYQANTNTYYGAFYNKNKEYVSAVQNQRVITPSVDGYVRISGLLTNMDIIQLVEGDTAPTTYEPYGKVWYIEKQTKKLDMSTITSWGINSAGNFYRTNFVNAYGLKIGKLYSNIFNYETTAWNGDYKIGITSSGNLWITTGDTTLSNIEDVPNWLSNKNAYLLGILTTPTYDTITNEELIEDLETLYTAKSQEGTTNISIISEYLPFILNISALEMTD